MAKRLFFLAVLMLLMLSACTSYDEPPDTLHVRVRLIYPEGNTIGPYAGARVELTNANASTFVSNTDAQGVATFEVPGGVYSAASSEVVLDTLSDQHYRYIFNGRKDQQVLSPDSLSNDISITLSMTRRRIWN